VRHGNKEDDEGEEDIDGAWRPVGEHERTDQRHLHRKLS